MEISQEYLKSRLSYDPLTGIFVWLPRADAPQWTGKWAGKVAGTVKTKGNGYRNIHIAISGKIYRAHRLAWLYATGEYPPDQIDHKNRDATDNRWENLRDSRGMNQRNKSMQRNNKSGVTGVSWSKVCSKWHARVWETVDGLKIYRNLGYFSELNAARVVVENFRIGLYDPGHGISPTPYPTSLAL